MPSEEMSMPNMNYAKHGAMGHSVREMIRQEYSRRYMGDKKRAGQGFVPSVPKRRLKPGQEVRVNGVLLGRVPSRRSR